MRIIILTQDENLYLPTSFAKVCSVYGDEVVCIVSSPAMSTHGSPLKGLIKHLSFFGFYGTFIMVKRVLLAKFYATLNISTPNKRFWSVKQVSRYFNIPFHHVAKVGSKPFFDLIEKYKPTLLVSISCPQIINKQVRDLIPDGCINVHGALLPKYRGLMPAFWAMKNGEKTTAVTVHELSNKLDNGDIILQKEIIIDPDDTWDSLVTKSKKAGAEVLIEAIQLFKENKVVKKPNPDEDATYFSFPTSSDRKAFVNAGRKFF